MLRGIEDDRDSAFPDGTGLASSRVREAIGRRWRGRPWRLRARTGVHNPPGLKPAQDLLGQAGALAWERCLAGPALSVVVDVPVPFRAGRRQQPGDTGREQLSSRYARRPASVAARWQAAAAHGCPAVPHAAAARLPAAP